jgi:hypothetical protein
MVDPHLCPTAVGVEGVQVDQHSKVPMLLVLRHRIVHVPLLHTGAHGHEYDVVRTDTGLGIPHDGGQAADDGVQYLVQF